MNQALSWLPHKLKVATLYFQQVPWNVVLPWLFSILISVLGPLVAWRNLFTYYEGNTEITLILKNNYTHVVANMLLHIMSMFSSCVALTILSAYYFGLKSKSVILDWMAKIGFLLGLSLIIWIWMMGQVGQMPVEQYAEEAKKFAWGRVSFPQWESWVTKVRVFANGYTLLMMVAAFWRSDKDQKVEAQ